MIKSTSPIGKSGGISLSTNTPSRQNQHLLRFRQNEIVEGKVLQTLTSDRALLLIKGREVMAKTPIPLKEGRTLSLITESTTPIPTFKPLTSSSMVASSVNVPLLLAAIKENIWESILNRILHYPDSGKYISALKSLLNQLGLQHLSDITPVFLKKVIDVCGWGWEAKLKRSIRYGSASKKDLETVLQGDLKGLTGKFLSIEKADKQIEKLLSMIQSFQLLNVTDEDAENRIFIPLPIQYPEGVFTVVQILIRLPENFKEAVNRKADGKDALSLTIQLDLTHLGTIRAGILLRGKALEGKFLVEKEDTKFLIETQLPVLKDRLAERGFQVSDIVCMLSDADIFQHPLFMEMIMEDNPTLNMVV